LAAALCQRGTGLKTALNQNAFQHFCAEGALPGRSTGENIMRTLNSNEMNFVSGGRGGGGAGGDRGQGTSSSASAGNGNPGTSTSAKNSNPSNRNTAGL
jgi:hypothetical protein